MTLTHETEDNTQPPLALYCRSTGRRLPPRQALEVAPGVARAVAVFEDGLSLSLSGDSLIGRSPHRDRRVIAGTAAPVVVDDPTKRISRCHLLLRFLEQQIQVVDLGSCNGTAVRGPDAQWHEVVPGIGTRINDGQRVRIASRVFRIHSLRS